MAPRPIAILFDLDGTLVDTIELIMRSMEFAFAEFDGRRPTRSEWLEGLGIPLRTQLSWHARSTEELDVLVARYRLFQGEHHDRMTTPFPGVAEVLAALAAAGHPMGVVTSKFHALANRALKHTGLAPYIDLIIGADSIENHKPHPQPVLTALQHLETPPDRALFVGDSPHDIACGNAAGVATVAVAWGPFSRDQLEAARPRYWLDSIAGLPRLLKDGPPEAEKTR
jgi:pyrophosphatase PpaX